MTDVKKGKNMNLYDDINFASFGVAGNFTGHLEQAGEAADFVNIVSAEKNAPKGVFPTYLNNDKKSAKNKKKNTPCFLNIFPFDSQKIIFPQNEEKIQIEPECAVLFKAEWKENKIINLKPLVFGASNDCSIRKQGAAKISEKKNWGKYSKGISENFIELDGFSLKSNINDYAIASFLIHDGDIFEYGENSQIKNYSYIYEQLVSWLLDKINNQKNEGPLENINEYLLESNKPENILVSIGATRYTQWGEINFLQNNDEAAVVVYPQSKYTKEQILEIVKSKKTDDKEVSLLYQKICRVE